MCGGRRPQPPQIIYQGPSQADIDRQNTQVEAMRVQASAQQKQITDQLQKQIDEANTRLVEQKTRLAEEQALATRAASQAEQPQNPYSVQTSQEAPAVAKTTSTTKAKDKARTGLKIAPGSTPTSAGTGLNIGV